LAVGERDAVARDQLHRTTPATAGAGRELRQCLRARAAAATTDERLEVRFDARHPTCGAHEVIAVAAVTASGTAASAATSSVFVHIALAVGAGTAATGIIFDDATHSTARAGAFVGGSRSRACRSAGGHVQRAADRDRARRDDDECSRTA